MLRGWSPSVGQDCSVLHSYLCWAMWESQVMKEQIMLASKAKMVDEKTIDGQWAQTDVLNTVKDTG